MNRRAEIEVCIDSVESAIAALEGGADRVELCADLPRGGTTPSLGLVEEVHRCCSLPLHVLIRPRPGDFIYSSHELRVIERDIDQVKRAGADGVVLGCLTQEGDVDTSRMRELVERARPMRVTFHRAFDVAREPIAALEDVIACGADMLLTSGQRPIADEGLALLAELVRRAGNRIRIMAGSGIDSTNASRIVSSSNIAALHTGTGVSERSATAGSSLFDIPRQRVSADRIRQLIASLSV